MAEIANLGFRADTKELAGAKSDLQAIVPAAEKAERAADNVGKSFDRAGKLAQAAAGGIGQAESAMERAASGANREATAMHNASNAVERKVGWIGRLINSLRGVGPASDVAAAGVRRVTTAANDNAGAFKANTGNIAAQFQDIGVTAAMGMNPLMIALQQGTQLSAVFAASGGNAFKVIGAAIASVLSPAALLTIGLVALLAYGLQVVDWANVAKVALNGLADALDMIAPYALAAGAALAILFAPAIVGIIGSIIGAIVSLGATIVGFAVSVIGLPGLLVVAIAAMAIDIANYFGVDLIAVVKKALNFIIGGFVGAFNATKASWSKLPGVLGDAAIQAANFVITAITGMVNRGIDQINGLIRMAKAVGLMGIFTPEMGHVDSGAIDNPYAGQLAAFGETVRGEISKATDGVDYLGNAADYVAGKFRKLGSMVRGIEIPGAKPKKGKAEKEAKPVKSEAEKEQERFDKLVTGAENYTRAKEAETAALSLNEMAAAKLKHQTELTNQATASGITITDERKKKIDELATAMANADRVFANAKAFKEIGEAAKGKQQDLQDQLAVIGMTADEAARYGNEVVWVREQLEKMKDATPDQIAAIKAFAAGMTDTEIAINKARKEAEKAKEALDFAKTATRGFIDDIRRGLAEGENIFKTFGNAVLNVIQRIADKMLDLALDQLFNPISAGGKGGGILGKIFGSVIGAFTGGGGSGAGAGISKLGGNISKAGFAKGGAFTNSIVSSPTLFSFANGGALGQMGEAGPEAIMPLRRGSDGSLGVQMHNDRQSAANNNMRIELVVRAEEGKMFRPTVEQIAEEKSVQITQAGLQQYDHAMPERVKQISNDERAR